MVKISPMRTSALIATLAALALVLSLACADEDKPPTTFFDGRVDLSGATPDTGWLDSAPTDLPLPDTREHMCGDNMAEGGEKCDGTDLDGKTCQKLGYFKGTLACTKKVCTFDVTRCSNCGNSKLDKDEHCDGVHHDGWTCQKLGYFKGTLSCTKVCLFDVAKCSNCGNGKLDKWEQCDGKEFGGKTCKSYGFTSGALACSGTCVISQAGCK